MPVFDSLTNLPPMNRVTLVNLGLGLLAMTLLLIGLLRLVRRCALAVRRD